LPDDFVELPEIVADLVEHKKATEDLLKKIRKPKAKKAVYHDDEDNETLSACIRRVSI